MMELREVVEVKLPAYSLLALHRSMGLQGSQLHRFDFISENFS